MAFPTEDLTVTEVALGPLILTHSGMATSPRILDVEIELNDEYISIMGGGPAEQILKMFLQGYGSGKMRFTCDRIVSISTIQGEKSTVLLRQQKPGASAKEWTLSADTAVFNPLSLKAERIKKETVIQFEVTPTSTTAGRPWAFNNNVSTV